MKKRKGLDFTTSCDNRAIFLTESYNDPTMMSSSLRGKYEFLETGSAAAILRAVNPEEWGDILDMLELFTLNPQSWLKAGGNRGDIDKEIDGMFEERIWAERRLDIETVGYLLNKKREVVHIFEKQYQEEYLVDNFKDRVALDVEWNAKDGNLDRNITAYRTWFKAGLQARVSNTATRRINSNEQQASPRLRAGNYFADHA